jgi:hypothetical protein
MDSAFLWKGANKTTWKFKETVKVGKWNTHIDSVVMARVIVVL